MTFNTAIAGLPAHLETLGATNSLIVLLVDAASLDLPDLRACLFACDRQRFHNVATFVIWNDNRTPQLERLVEETMKVCSSQATSDALASSLEFLTISSAVSPNETRYIRTASQFSVLPTLNGEALQEPR